VYALGAVLFECLAGAPPYPEGEPYERTLYRILQEPTPRLADVAPDAPAPLVGLVTAMMARDPNARPASARDVRARLAAIYPNLRQRALYFGPDPVHGAPPSLAPPPPPRTASAVILESRGPTLAPAARKVTSLGLAALGAMVTLSIGVAIVVTRGNAPLVEASAVSTGAPAPPMAELETTTATAMATSTTTPAPPVTGTAALTTSSEDPVHEALDALEHGDAARAKDLATEGLRRTPTDPEVWLALGAADEALGDKVSARRAYEACVRGARGERVAECRALVAR
jgi:serine/threonine-protein kinase